MWMIRDLHSAMEREKAPIGVFICAANPTRPMERGRRRRPLRRRLRAHFPRLQVLTLAELFQGKKPDIPFVDPASVKRAKREDVGAGKQEKLL